MKDDNIQVWISMTVSNCTKNIKFSQTSVEVAYILRLKQHASII